MTTEFLENSLKEHLKKASNFTTNSTLKLRVVFDLAQKMGVSRQMIYETKDAVYVDPSVSAVFEDLWKGRSLLTGDDSNIITVTVKENMEDVAVVEKFLAKDFVKPNDISKFVALLQKRSFPIRDLWCLFAVDGLEDNRFEPYFENLSVPLTLGERFENETDREAHVRAVRTIYRDARYATPERLAATLRTLFGLDGAVAGGRRKKRHRGDGGSSPSDESSSSSDDEEDCEKDDDENNNNTLFDKYIADLYKRLVGSKFESIRLVVISDKKMAKETDDDEQPPKKKPKKKIQTKKMTQKKKKSTVKRAKTFNIPPLPLQEEEEETLMSPPVIQKATATENRIENINNE